MSSKIHSINPPDLAKEPDCLIFNCFTVLLIPACLLLL